MNIKSLLNKIVPIIAVCLFIVGCSSEEPANTNETNGKSIRFSAVDINGSRVSYDKYASSFESGDKIGCVIVDLNQAEGNDRYLANSCWEYNENGFLVLKKLFDREYKSLDISSNNIIVPDAEKLSEGEEYVKLMDETASYEFRFYYPYVDEEDMKQDFISAADTSMVSYPKIDIPVTQGTGTDILFITSNYLAMSLGLDSKNGYWEPIYRASWTEYPIFVNVMQKTKRQSNFSDFMVANAKATNSSGTVRLRFLKKMAAIEVNCDVPLDDIYFQQSEKGVYKGKTYDFTTSEVKDITYATQAQWDAPLFKKSGNDLTKERMYPFHTVPDTQVRLILPPQENFSCNMNFRLGDTDYSVELGKKIKELKENTLYIIHINKAGECTLVINDWQEGGNGVIVDRDKIE